MSFPNRTIVNCYHLCTKTKGNPLHDRKFHPIELGTLVAGRSTSLVGNATVLSRLPDSKGIQSVVRNNPWGLAY